MSAPQSAPRTPSRSRGGDPVPPASTRKPTEPHPLEALHEAFGNLGVVRRLADPALQTRLEIGAPDDEYEREADAVAASIVGSPPSREPPSIRRRAEDDDKKKPAPPQRPAGAAAKAPTPAPAAAPAPKAPVAPVPAVKPVPLATQAPKAPATAAAPPKAAAAALPVSAPKAPEPPKPAPAPKPPVAVPTLNADKAKVTAPPPPPHAGGTTTMHPERRREEPTVAAKAEPGAVPSVTPRAARTIQSQEGAGQPLSPRDRGFFETRLGHDLGGVRIHDDSAARTAARDVEAQAFTHGQDIYFSAGRYQPGTVAGRELLAHELAHTIQQRPGAPVARRIQRVPTDTPSPSPPGHATTSDHRWAGLTVNSDAPPIDLANPPPQLHGKATGAGGTRRLSFERVDIPGFKLVNPPAPQWNKSLGPYIKRAGFVRPPDIQIATWRNQVGLTRSGGPPPDGFNRQLETLVNARHHGEHAPLVPTAVYRLRRRGGGADGLTYSGTPQALARELSIPGWTSGGADAPAPYQVDHMRELQLADYPYDAPGNHWTDQPTNLWLLHGPTNMDSGRHIQGAISTTITSFRDGIHEYYRLREVAGGNRRNPVAAADAAMRADLGPSHAELLDTRTANATYLVEFDQVTGGLAPPTVPETHYWQAQQIRDGAHLHVLEATAAAAAPYITIFANEATAAPAAAGGGPGPGAAVTLGVTGLDFDPRTVEPRARERRFLPPLAVVEKHLTETPTGNSYGYLVMDFIRNRNLEFPAGANRRLDIHAVGGVDRAGVIDSSQAIALLTGARYKELSPIEILSAGIEPGRGFGVHGRIRADVPLLREGIDFEVAGDEISVYKEFGAGALSVPAPFHVTDASLRLSAGTRTGLQVGGNVNFAIDRVGSGHIGAVAGREGLQLAGDFDFATDFFQPASIGVTFAHDAATGENHWGAHGDLGIPAGRVRGIRSALLHVSYADERLDATGHATFDIPGVRDADVHLTYDPQTGLMITGAATLGQLPGIRGGSLEVTLSERPGGGGYKVAAHGTAQPAIPGVDVAELAIAYDDGGFFAHASMSLQRGLISGSVDVGATNRPIDEQGRPQMDGEPLPQVAIFGSGSATVQITPWLRGTAGIRLLPNGEIAVSGRLTIPAFNLWNPITPDPVHLIHPPPIHFPIFGPVVLEIGGGLDAVYGLGAGVLSGDLGLDYNPSHEDQTHLYGDLSLHASAFAGLELDLFAGVGLDALVASVTGRITLGAQVRGEVAADAGVHVDWTPGAGISFDGHVSGSIAPKLIFHLDASIVVSALLWDHTWTKELGRREFGSSLELSVMLPFHWQEGQAFAIDWNRLEFHHPDLDPLQTAKDFIEEVV